MFMKECNNVLHFNALFKFSLISLGAYLCIQMLLSNIDAFIRGVFEMWLASINVDHVDVQNEFHQQL